MLELARRGPHTTRASFPAAGVIGLAASAAAIGLWTVERLTELLVVVFLTAPFKLALLAAPLFFLSDLSAFLHGRPRVAVSLYLALVTVTLCAMLAYLPWRHTFTEHFSNEAYRWYYDGMLAKHGGDEDDFADWQRSWANYTPHIIEAGLVLAYYGALIKACTARRLSKRGGALIAAGGYALLWLIPLLGGLILWDYDIFLKGIVFDSISLDLLPLLWWRPWDYSIFLYIFMLIFFGVCTAFFLFKPRSAD
jgi:hypothetical protein